jgi:hypothetical protein
MKRIELLKLHKELLERLELADVKMEDWRYARLLDDIEAARKKGGR